MSRILGLNYGDGQTPDNVSVTTSSTEIAAASESRKWIILSNIGNKDVFIAIGQPALVDKGILLHRDAGQLLFSAELLSDQAINGITSSGSSTVAFQEGQ